VFDCILSTFEEIVWESVNRINVAQDWDRWQVLVNIVLNLQLSLKCEECLGQLRNYSSRKTAA
jgi:hypothetical protein